MKQQQLDERYVGVDRSYASVPILGSCQVLSQSKKMRDFLDLYHEWIFFKITYNTSYSISSGEDEIVQNERTLMEHFNEMRNRLIQKIRLDIGVEDCLDAVIGQEPQAL